MTTPASETTFDILGYLRKLVRYLLPALLVGALVAAGSFWNLHKAPATYTATSTLVFEPVPVKTEAEATQQSANVQSQMRNYRQIASSPVLMGPLAKKLGAPHTVDELTSGLTVTLPLQSLMLTFGYTSSNQNHAIKVVNEAAAMVAAQSQSWANRTTPTLNVQVVNTLPAVAPLPKTAPSSMQQMLLALVAGALAALLTAMLLDAVLGRRRRARAAQTVPATALPARPSDEPLSTRTDDAGAHPADQH